MKEDKNKLKSHIQAVQKQRQDELERKKYQILKDQARKAEIEEQKKEFARRQKALKQ